MFKEHISTGLRSPWILLFTHLFGISKQLFSSIRCLSRLWLSVKKEMVIPRSFLLPVAFRSFGWDMSLFWDTDFNLRVWSTEICSFTHSINHSTNINRFFLSAYYMLRILLGLWLFSIFKLLTIYWVIHGKEEEICNSGNTLNNIGKHRAYRWCINPLT